MIRYTCCVHDEQVVFRVPSYTKLNVSTQMYSLALTTHIKSRFPETVILLSEVKCDCNLIQHCVNWNVRFMYVPMRMWTNLILGKLRTEVIVSFISGEDFSNASTKLQ